MKNIFLALCYAVKQQGDGFILGLIYIIVGTFSAIGTHLVMDEPNWKVDVVSFIFMPIILLLVIIIVCDIISIMFSTISKLKCNYKIKMEELKSKKS